ncbi:MAG: hypothetical protein AB8B88_11555 [Devosiaceae bacterium]
MTTLDATESLLTTGLRAELSDLQSDVSHMSGELTKGLAQALVEGRELDGLLQKMILAQADSAMNKAVGSAYDLVGSLGESLVGAALGGLSGGLSGGAANIFNVNVASPSPASFRNSETQLAASLSRAVSRGQRGM